MAVLRVAGLPAAQAADGGAAVGVRHQGDKVPAVPVVRAEVAGVAHHQRVGGVGLYVSGPGTRQEVLPDPGAVRADEGVVVLPAAFALQLILESDLSSAGEVLVDAEFARFLGVKRLGFARAPEPR